MNLSDRPIQERIKKGESLFLEGKLAQSKQVFLNLLKDNPSNADILNNLGAIAHTLERYDEAEKFFVEALQTDKDHADATFNLATLVQNRKHCENEAPHPNKIAERKPEDLYANTKGNIVFLCLPGLESFLRDIIDYFGKIYNVRTCFTTNGQKIESTIQWADIIWLEWANEMTVHVTNNLGKLIKNKEVVCRIHSYEVLDGYLPRIEWSIIDKALFVAEHVLKIAQELHPALFQKTETMVIHNGLDLRQFPFRERKPGYNIALVNGISHKKNPSMWIEIINRITKIDQNYTLKIAGQFQEIRYKYYLENIIGKLGLAKNIKFFGQVNSIPEWFDREDINYLLTTSPFESFGYSIAEAMAMGCRPLIHAFPNAEDIWPSDCIFQCTDELIPLIQDRKNYNSYLYRHFVENKYSLDNQIENIKALFSELSCQNSKQCVPCDPQEKMKEGVKEYTGRETIPDRYHRPDKNLIVTGIPRSGTSLFSALLNTFKNSVCLNEILYDIAKLPEDFADIRRRLIAGEEIPNRYDSSGKLATDTQSGAVSIEHGIIQGVDENVLIGSKVNIPYLNHLQKIIAYNYKIIALVRDPVYAIGSWNSQKASIIPEAHVVDDDMHPRWRGFDFASMDKIERQAQIWNLYAHLIWNHREKIKIYTYELLTTDLDWVIKDMSDFLGLEPPSNLIEVKNQNIHSKYPDILKIQEAVREYCPIKNVFGYSYLDYGELNTRDKNDNELTGWSGDINYSRRPFLCERGIDPSHLVIAFGGIANMLYFPPFEFFRATNSFPYSRILVRDFNQAWYHLGVDRNYASFEEVVQELNQIIGRFGPKTITITGTSAGGYASLAFGHFLKADFVQALAPQTFIDPINRKRIGEKRWQREVEQIYSSQPPSKWFYDLKDLLKDYNGKTLYNIHVCRNHELDLSYAEHLEGLPGIRVERYGCDAHNIAQYLKSNDILPSLLEKPYLRNKNE